jgi:hypothetical protein
VKVKVAAISSLCKFWSSHDPESGLVITTSSPKNVDQVFILVMINFTDKTES